ncbi:MAG: CopD family protein [Candidatus Thermoplasmatota archaeon]
MAAHAVYASSVPSEGEHLSAAPTTVQVTLTETPDHAASRLTVTDSSGRRVDRDDTTFDPSDDRTMRVSLEPLGPGAYLVTWRALSGADGHVTTGSFGFAIGDATPPASSMQTADESPASMGWRVIAYAGLALAVGVSLYRLMLPRGQSLDATWSSGLTAIAGALVGLGAIGLLLDTSSSANLSLPSFLGTTLGLNLAIRILAGAALLLLGMYALRHGRLRPALPLLLAAVAALASARFAHSSGSGILAISIDAIHYLAGAAWVGGLFILLVDLTRHRTFTARTILERAFAFSKVALWAVLIVALTGTLSTLLILGPDLVADPFSLFDSRYGTVLGFKVAAAAAMVGLAAINRFVHLRRLARTSQDEPARATAFRRTIAMEAVVGAAVLALAGILTAIAPPVMATAPEAIEIMAHGDTYMARIVFDPAPLAGQPSHPSITVTRIDTGANEGTATCGRDSCLRLTLVSQADPSLGASSFDAIPNGAGAWMVHNLLLVRSGAYDVTLSFQTGDVFLDELPFTLHVRG